MDNIQHPDAAKKALKAKFRGHKTLACKAKPRFPESPEREYRRMMNEYNKIIHQELKKKLPQMMEEYKLEKYGARMDDRQDLERNVREAFREIAVGLEKKLSSFRVDKKLAAIARMTKGSSYREWKREVKNTFGIDLLDEHYNADFYERHLKKWVDDNALKIKSIPVTELGDMQDIILDGFRQGRTIRDIQRDVQERYNSSKSDARFLARDQIATLNAEITQAQQTDAGVRRYRWSSSHDQRVRDCHQALDGKVFSWDDPPEMWYDTKSRGRVYTGRRCHPGEDIGCRCVAIPVFDFDTLNMQAKDT